MLTLDLQDEYKRSTQVNDFMHSKPPATGYSNMSDSRLDPEAGAHRNSAGSLGPDNQDYSRKILRVSSAQLFGLKATC